MSSPSRSPVRRLTMVLGLEICPGTDWVARFEDRGEGTAGDAGHRARGDEDETTMSLAMNTMMLGQWAVRPLHARGAVEVEAKQSSHDTSVKRAQSSKATQFKKNLSAFRSMSSPSPDPFS
jgi:hypothetical protein